MKIPTVFTLAGLQIQTIFVDESPHGGVVGKAVYTKQQIKLYTKGVAEQTLQQAYIHELTHWILFIMGETKLRNNERFVDLFAHFFYQVFESIEK